MRTGWAAALVGAGGIVIAPASARACSYGLGPDIVVPAGAAHPSNAAVVLVGSLMSPDALTATIDDVPVELVVDDTLATRHIDNGVVALYRVLAVRLEPQPEPGQQVHIGGHACGEQRCPDLDLTYVASEPDLEIAGDAPTVSFDVARYSSTGGNSCATWGSLLWTHATVDTDALQDEPLVLYEVTARHRESGLEGTTRDVLAWLEFGPLVLFPEYGEAFPLDGWCVDVGMLDASGNAGPVTRSCDACGVYAGAPVSSVDEIPFMPVAGGPCDLGGESSGAGSTDGGEGTSSHNGTAGDEAPDTSTGVALADESTTTPAAPTNDVEGRGCGCNFDSEDPPCTGAALAALVIVGARSRRRRS